MIKKPDFFPSLVCTNTQIPIIGWESRYITRKEGLKLQSLKRLKLPENDNAAFKALDGNNLGGPPIGSDFPFQSFCPFLTKRISTVIPNENSTNT